MNHLFIIIRNALLKSAECFHTTYNAINIIVYYLLIPLTWTMMIDWKLKMPWSTSLLIVVWTVIIIRTQGHFKQWCDRAFMKSVEFLLWFRHIGWDYVVASVIICVVVPLLIYVGLILW